MTLLALLIALASVALTAVAVVLGPPPLDEVLPAAIPVLATYSAVGFVIVWRRRESPIGWLLLAVPISFSASVLADAYGALAARPGAALPAGTLAVWLGYWVWVPGWLAMSFLFLLFPNGRLPSASWRPAAVLTAVLDLVALVLSFFDNDTEAALSKIVNPLRAELPFSLYPVVIAALLLSLVPPIASLIARYRRSGGDERQQLKWLAFGSVLMVALFLSFLSLPSPSTNPVASVLFYVGITLPPIAIAIAILRYRLYDIDLLINRALVYGAVTGTLVATYALAVLLFQQLFRPLTAGSDLAIAASTLVIAALFQPLRRRIQEAVDRRFYRRKYDAAKTIDAFSGRLRQEIDLDTLSAELLGVVGETMQPASATLWLRERPGARL